MEELSRATFREKEVDKMPKGAKILSREISVTVEEIENGFLVSKTTDTKYETSKGHDYSYITRKYFSKTNPLTMKLDNTPLADKIDE
jgi:hypothetical protein